MKFAYTILYVPDVVRAIEVYERAFDFQRGFVSESGGYGQLQATEFSMCDSRLVSLR